jgi:t-SNARE complex subunit (syntaxin)
MIKEFKKSRNLSREMRKLSDVNQQNIRHCRINIDDNAEFDNDFQISLNEYQLKNKLKAHSKHKLQYCDRKNYSKKSVTKLSKNMPNSINNC